MKHIHCPVNGWDCPYYTDVGHPAVVCSMTPTMIVMTSPQCGMLVIIG